MSLIGYVAKEICAPIFRTSWLGGEYVLVGEYMSCSQCVFEAGAVLGWTFRDKMPVFVQLLCESGRDSDVTSYLRKNAASRLAQVEREPSNFWDVYGKPELIKRFSRLEDFAESAKVKVWLKDVDVRSQLAIAVGEGIGFGSTYPDLAERLLASQFDGTMWNDARSHGLDIAPLPPNDSPHQRREQILSIIKPYVAEVRPDLMSVLGL